MSGRAGDVSIIMPTTASRERATSLVRAIDTVVSQHGVRGVPLVVVNGTSGAPEVLEQLRRRVDIRLTMLEEANLPAALYAGRVMVDTPYFAVLDDDDELLPGALRTRLDALEGASGADIVVTNGFLVGCGRCELSIRDFDKVRIDPLRTLLVNHWLPPCGAFFRTSAVTAEFFEGMPRYREWTYLALRLALSLHINFVEQPTFVYRTDTPDSLSKSRAYCLAGPSAVARMLELPLPVDVRAALRVRLAADMHSASSRELAESNYRAAWWWHGKTLAQSSGWRYLPYGRKLLLGSLSGLIAAVRIDRAGSM